MKGQHYFLKLHVTNHFLSFYSPEPLLPKRTLKTGPGVVPNPPLSPGASREAGCPAQMHGALLYPSEGQSGPTLPSGIFPPPPPEILPKTASSMIFSMLPLSPMQPLQDHPPIQL